MEASRQGDRGGHPNDAAGIEQDQALFCLALARIFSAMEVISL
jgi:hypothetical protein